jgi:hypothetical protein
MALPVGAVVVVAGPIPVPPEDPEDEVVVFELDGVEGEELQAESPRAPAKTKAAMSVLERKESWGMAAKGSRWLGRPHRGATTGQGERRRSSAAGAPR